MRRFILLSLTIGSLIGLPRLADVFREKTIPSKNLPDVGALSGRMGKASQGEALLSSDKGPQELSSSAPPPAAKTSSASLTGDELVLAVKKELIRLGFYHGPLSPRWNHIALTAANRFAQKTGLKIRNLSPTHELLQALRSAKSKDAKSITQGASDFSNMQLANLKPEEKGKAGGPPRAASQAGRPAKPGVHSYLPPWIANKDAGSPRGAGKTAPIGKAMHGKVAEAGRTGNRRIRRAHLSRHSHNNSSEEFASLNSERHSRRGKRMPFLFLRSADFSWPWM